MSNEAEVVCGCGCKLFWESRACSGSWKVLLNSKGEIQETDLDQVVTSGIPKTVTCAQCGKRNPNPRKNKRHAY